MKNHYIQAVIELIKSGTDIQELHNGLKKSMERKGHMRLYGSVLRGTLRILETQTDHSKATVIVSEDTDIQKYASDITGALKKLGAQDDFSTEIDPTIIGGVVIKHNNTLIDRSYKTTLTNLYRSITK